MKSKTLIYCIVLLVGILSCQKNTSQSDETPNEFKASEDYSADWQAIEKLEKRGASRDIILSVNQILTKAKNEANYHQVFKALAYRSKYINQIEEDAHYKILNSYLTEVRESEFPLNLVLHSAIAELYTQYLNANRWKFQNRTVLSEESDPDFRNWSLDKLHQNIRHHYLKSLQETEKSSMFPLEYLDPILLNSDPNTPHLHDNLFDLLSFRAINYFKSSPLVNKGLNEFEMDAHPLFSDREDFIKMTIDETDTSDNQFLVMRLYQAILSQNISKDKMLSYDLDRLRHYHITSQLDEKDSLYESSLLRLKNEFTENHEITHDLASFYLKKGAEGSDKWNALKAHKLLVTEDLSADDFGSLQSKKLLTDLLKPQLSFQLEQMMTPNAIHPFLLKFKNLHQFYFRLVNVSSRHAHLKTLKDQKSVLKDLLSMDATHDWKQFINYTADYKEHSTELTIPKLEVGHYYLIASADSLFLPGQSLINYAPFQISQLAKTIRTYDEQCEIYVLNRTNGEPIEKASIKVYEYKYGWDKQAEVFQSLTTDKKGYAAFLGRKGNRYQFIIYKGQDTLKEGYAHVSQPLKNEKRKNLHLFTDRAIYRPGQTVYYKGILYQSNNHSATVIHDQSIGLELYDVNHQKLQSHSKTTNAYGSVQGSFTLPTDGLNGRYRIQTNHGSIAFSVEEYKRPTFKIEFDSLMSAHQLNDSVSIKGTVKAFSGNAISQANVQYRVIRNSQTPLWFARHSYFSPFYSISKEIVHGEAKSDVNGQIEIKFKAKAPKTSNPHQFYNYEVLVTATSSNGETQNASFTVPIAKQSILIGTNLNQSKAFTDDFKDLKILAKTISNQAVNTEAELSLYKLKPSTTYAINRSWNAPDIWTLNPKTYDQIHLSYRPANDAEIEYLVSRSIVKTNQTLNLFNELEAGKYLLKVNLKDNSGKTIQYEQQYELRASKSSANKISHFFEVTQLNKNLSVGDTAKLLLSTSLASLPLLYEIELNHSIINRQQLNLKNEQLLLSIPITEKYRGGFQLYLNGIHSNRFLTQTIHLLIPYENKKLQLNLKTFRNKVEPGSKEKWTVSVSDHLGKKINGELLMTMYDGSLDQFQAQQWHLFPFHQSYAKRNWTFDRVYATSSRRIYRREFEQQIMRSEPQLNWFGFSMHPSYRNYYSKLGEPQSLANDHVMVAEASMPMENQEASVQENLDKSAEEHSSSSKTVAMSQPTKFKIRKDFKETAFFYPQIQVNQDEVTFNFYVPEVFTNWKFMAMAHTKDLSVGQFSKNILSQKEVMVFPNAPRFLREEDQLTFSALVANTTDRMLNTKVKLEFFNPLNDQIVAMIDRDSITKNIVIEPNGNSACSWDITVPKGYKILAYRIVASTDQHSDGEQQSIPVLLNRKLITESLPISLRGGQQKQLQWEKLKASADLPSMEHKSLTLEYTPNPIWYAIQALPSLSEDNTKCTEQQFSLLFANGIAEKVIQLNPRISTIFETWKSIEPDALLSNLEKNPELKSALISSTPWLKEAKNESDQKRRIGVLFDFNQMALKKQSAINHLKALQYNDGSWPWYKGMRSNRYMTQYILAGLGRMYRMNIPTDVEMTEKAVQYLDQKYIEEYYQKEEQYLKNEPIYISPSIVHYLFVRSFFTEIPLPKDRKAFDFYMQHSSRQWTERNPYLKAMMALTFYRFKPTSNLPQQILSSLKQTAIYDDEMGMYWKSNGMRGHWHEAKIESQALIIEAFQEMAPHSPEIEELKIWLLKQKQTQSWPNSKSTSMACYALISNSTPLLLEEGNFNISIGDEIITPNNQKTEAGTNYFKKQWHKDQINAKQGNIKVVNNSQSIAWGAMYWQYYQTLDQITEHHESGLKIEKQMYKVVLRENGEVLIPISQENIQKGDLIRTRLNISSDRDLEFVHLNDMRTALLEPIQVKSNYQYQGGLSFYQSITDTSTDYFFDRLPKGRYILEHTNKATISGNVSKGISTIQCFYAPEFVSHSKGERVLVR